MGLTLAGVTGVAACFSGSKGRRRLFAGTGFADDDRRGVRFLGV